MLKLSTKTTLQKLESLFRGYGCAVATKGKALVARCPFKDKDIPLAIEVEDALGFVRISIPTDLQADESAENLLKLNFENYGIKLSIDPEGYIAVSIDLPLKCFESMDAKSVLELVKNIFKFYVEFENLFAKSEEEEANE